MRVCLCDKSETIANEWAKLALDPHLKSNINFGCEHIISNVVKEIFIISIQLIRFLSLDIHRLRFLLFLAIHLPFTHIIFKCHFSLSNSIWSIASTCWSHVLRIQTSWLSIFIEVEPMVVSCGVQNTFKQLNILKLRKRKKIVIFKGKEDGGGGWKCFVVFKWYPNHLTSGFFFWRRHWTSDQ